MASFRNLNVSEKTKLQRELQFYTNLVSNHEKLLQTGKVSDVKQSALTKPYERIVKLGNCKRTIASRSNGSATTTSPFPQKSVTSNENVYSRSVIQNKLKNSLSTPSLFLKRSFIKPSTTEIKRNLNSATAYRKVNNNQQRTVLHNTKVTVPTRLVLPPQNTLKSTNGAVSKLHVTISNQSKDLQKALSETKKTFMKIGSKKQIDELNALTKQLEKRNRNIKCKSLPRCSVNSSESSDTTKSSHIGLTPDSLENKNVYCNNKSELDVLKYKVENVAKMLSIGSKDSSKKILSESVSCSSKKVPELSSLTSANAKAPMMCSIMKDKSLLSNNMLLPLNQVSKVGISTVTKLVKSPKCVRCNCASTSGAKEVNLHKLSNIKKSLVSLQATNVKSAQIKNIHSKTLGLSRESSEIGKQKELLKCLKPSQMNCTLTPVTKRVKLHKLSSLKKRRNTVKLIASKYKIVNKNLSNSLMLSSKSTFFKGRSAASPNSFNKRFQCAYKAPGNKKTLNSNYKVVNRVKSPKQFNNSLLNASTPKCLIKPKFILKKQKLETIGSSKKSLNTPRQNRHIQKSFAQNPALKPKLIFKHTKVNYMVRANSESLSTAYLNRKSITRTANSKYQVVNRPGSSKKLLKSPNMKYNVIHRTKSGVDIDLLLELAAEKDLMERENGIKTFKKRAVLLKRVYKTKNAIINKNVCSSTGTKVAKMIKAKYSLNKKNAWKNQSFSKRFIDVKHYKGHPLSANFQRIPNRKQFNNFRNKRYYFSSPIQNHKHVTNFLRNHKGTLHYNKTYQKSFIRNDFLKSQMKCTPISKVLAGRVLHQSINRVLTASVKKKLSKVNIYCMFYNRFGRCNKGLKCTYVHDPSKIAVCTRFLRGTCKNKKCLFSHEISPGKMAICSFFLVGSCTKTDCPYRHETLSADAELCKAFVQGYCPDGKQCKKAHVLVCPQYIQGFCDKGDACAFPHPPPKEKKILLKPLDKSETPVEAENFMERVSRYFQHANEQTVEISETAVVPKRQKLPEQPSFIAL